MSIEPAPGIREILLSLGVDPRVISSRKLPAHQEATDLVIADISQSGREHLLAPAAAEAWQKMQAEAQSEQVRLIIISAFRSVQRQAELIRCRLDEGLDAAEILNSSAPPGYSEHHTGQAMDIGTPGCMPLSLEFEATPAFGWLSEHAGKFGFRLSYPRDNLLGFCYEPWHWRYFPVDG